MEIFDGHGMSIPVGYHVEIFKESVMVVVFPDEIHNLFREAVARVKVKEVMLGSTIGVFRGTAIESHMSVAAVEYHLRQPRWRWWGRWRWRWRRWWPRRAYILNFYRVVHVAYVDHRCPIELDTV